MKRRHLLGSLAAVGSAGCLRVTQNEDTPTPGGDGGGAGGSSPDGDAGGAPTPDDGGGSTGSDDGAGDATDGSSAVDYPLGLTDDGVEPLLADAHLNELVGESFELSWSDVDVTRGRIAEERDYRVDGGRAIAEWSYQGPITRYEDADGSFWREDLGDVVTYGQDREPYDIRRILLTRRLRAVIRAGVWDRPEPEPREGLGTVFHVRAEGVDEPGPLAEEFEMSALESFAADGEVDDSGVILHLNAEFEGRDATEDDRLIAWRFTYEFGSHGDVTVSKPDWLQTARERAPDVSAGITDDGRFIEMEHAGGNPILPGTAVVLWDQERRVNWGYRENREPFEAGTTLYLWMADDELHWRRDERPAGVDPQPLDGRYGFWMHRGGATYFGAIGLG